MAERAPTADELLAHTDWLMQLARALVGEAHAPDVVQQTYEIALDRPPREGGPLRPWLGGVARNVARMMTRGRVRREHREEQVAPPLDAPTPDALVARAQMQQVVARLVLELPEPLRATLLLRFFEGWTAAEIARAQRIPAATVRSRLKDALDRIRGALDRQHGERRRWVVLVAPLPVVTASRDAAAATLAGGLLVKAGLKALVAIVVVAIAVVLGTRWLGWWGGADGGAAAPAPVAAHVVAKEARPPAGEPVAPAAPRTAALIYDDDPRGSVMLEGQVIDEHDQPVPGARVAIDANPPIIVETEANGSFVFEGLIPRDYRIEATAGEGYAGPAQLRLSDKPEPVTLVMRPGAAVDVTVIEKVTGAPVAGAEVERRSTLTWRATTGADGVARLRGLGAVWAPIAVRAAGYSPTAIMMAVTGDAAAPQQVALSLARGAAVAGRVIDEAGKPVEGARIVATSASDAFPVVDARRDGVITGADGRFAFPTLAAGTWRLSAALAGHAPATSPPLTLDGATRVDGVELVLGAGAVLRGIVRDRAGQPVASAAVRVVARGQVEWRARRQAFSGPDGRFELTGLPRRAVEVVAWHDRGTSAIASADLAAAREREVALVLEIEGAIAGKVVDRAGHPVGDAQVIAAPELGGGVAELAAWSVRGVQIAVSDQGGAFRFAGLPDGAYRIRAARAGAPEFALSLSPGVVARPGEPPVRVTVASEGRLVGKVAFADGKPVPAFTIGVGGTPPTSFVAKDGAFALPVIGGTHSIVVAGPGFVQKHVDAVVIAEGKDSDVGTISVTPGRSVSGRVLDETGAPVRGARVAAGALLTGGGSELYIKDESIDAKDTETDEHGRFALDGFGPASLTVVAGKDGLGRSASARIPVGTESAALDLVLQPVAGLEGTITRSGAPAADTVVIANPIGAVRSAFFVTTGPDGKFVLDALAPGPYIVYPMFGEGGRGPKDTYVRRVEVVLGKRAKVDIDGTLGGAALQVSVKTDQGGPVMMAQVIAMQTKVEAETLDQITDGTKLPVLGDEVIPTYIRQAPGGQVEVQGVRAGLHTVCAAPIGPATKMSEPLRLKCAQVLVAAAGKAKVELVVPAVWVEGK